MTTDRLLDGRVSLLQPEHGYRVAIDPVFLAASVIARPGQTVLDLGCGTGAAALCLAVRCPEIVVQGIEIDAGVTELAKRSASLSGVAGRFAATVGDLRDAVPNCADHVIANPPYVKAGGGTRAPDAAKHRAHQETDAELEDWVAAAFRAVRHKGSVIFILNAERLDVLVAAVAAERGGEVTVYPLWPKAGRAARRAIVRVRKGVASPARLLSGLVLHAENGDFTEAANDVLRGARPLPGWPAPGGVEPD